VRYELNFIYVMWKKVDRLCGLVVRVPGYKTEMYCASCEVRTEYIYIYIYVMWEKVDRLCGQVVKVPGYRSRGPGSVPGATWLCEK
jgi:3-methyladenine DNA glycosylase AlkD